MPLTRTKRVLWIGLYVVLALFYTEFTLKSNHPFGRASPSSLALFEAWMPYQARVLVPAIARVVYEVSGATFFTIYFGILWASILGLLLAFRSYLARFVPAPGHASWSTALLIIVPLAWNYSTISPWPVFYPSDIPAILLFQIGLTTLLRNRLFNYYAFFAIACFNRETACFLSFVFLFTRIGVIPTRKLLTHVAAQAALWLAIKITLQIVFSDHEGSVVDVMAQRNLSILKLLVNLCWTQSHTAILTVFGGIYLLIPLAWRDQPRFLKRSLWVVLPFVGGMSIVGNLDELRIYGELIPILSAPAAFALCHRLGWTGNLIRNQEPSLSNERSHACPKE